MKTYMVVDYKPEGGRFGVGFNCYCPECDEYLGNTSEDSYLQHPVVKNSEGGFWFFRRSQRGEVINCKNAGKKLKIQLPQMILEELKVGEQGKGSDAPSRS